MQKSLIMYQCDIAFFFFFFFFLLKQLQTRGKSEPIVMVLHGKHLFAIYWREHDITSYYIANQSTSCKLHNFMNVMMLYLISNYMHDC